MAQETAGTIGIPVLKNELLPYLTDYAKRSERAELYKQKAEQRAAELAAKKAAEKEAELNRYIPPAFEIAKGGYWQPAIKKRMEAEQATALQRIKDAKTTAEKAKASQDYSNIMQELNYGGEQETQKQKENVKALRESGYNVDENALAQYYTEQAATNPNFFGTNHIVNFKEWAKSKPQEYINPAAIGTSLLKQYQPVSVGIKTREGKDESFTYNPLFEPERVKDQLTGANILRADKPNLVKIQEALEANPNLREAADAYIDPIAARIKSNAPGISSTEAYTLAAEEFFGKSLPQGRAKETYDYSEVSPKKGGAGGGGKPPVNIETKGVGPRSVDVSTYTQIGKPVGGKVNLGLGRQQVTIGDPNTDVETTYSRPYDVNANVSIYLLQRPEDISSDKAVINRYLTQKNDGSYTLKTGFEYQTPVYSTLYFADKDFWVYGPTGKKENAYLIKKGTVLDNETALNYMRQGESDKVRKVKGYEVTANMAIPYETRRGDIVERVRPSIKMFIPEGNAASIKKHIEMERRKMESANAPQAASEEKVIRF